MVRSAYRLLRLVALCLAAVGPASAATEDATGATVLLTFDVEEPGDAEALAALDLDVRATYFFTGHYGRTHPDLVRALAREGNTIGSHSFFHHDMTTLSPYQRELDLQMSRVALQALSCVPVRWFRPPYLEYDDVTMRQAAEAGFAFSSADKDPWPRNPAIPELPVATHAGGLVSDWDIFAAYGDDNAGALQFLVDALTAHKEVGRPFVVLLHPRIIGTRPEVLRDFIAHAEASGARFVTADDLLTEMTHPLPNRVGLWLDRNPAGPEARRIAAEVVRLGVTDLVVPLSPAGTLPAPESRLDPALAGLRAEGVRILGAMSLLRSPELLSRRPDLAMMNAFGRRSSAWASPSHPEVWEHAIQSARELSADPALDGLLLTDLRYPDLGFDHSPVAHASFSDASGLQVRTADDLLGRYPEWARWRTGELASLVDAVVQAAKGVRGPDFIAGASFPSEAALNFRAVEFTGQDLLRLAPLLDLAVMTVSSEGLARKPGLLVRTQLGTEARTGRTEVLLAVTPPLAVGTADEAPPPVRATILFGNDGDSSRPAPVSRWALRLLPDRVAPGPQPAWLDVPENCAGQTTLPSQ